MCAFWDRRQKQYLYCSTHKEKGIGRICLPLFQFTRYWLSGCPTHRPLMRSVVGSDWWPWRNSRRSSYSLGIPDLCVHLQIALEGKSLNACRALLLRLRSILQSDIACCQFLSPHARPFQGNFHLASKIRHHVLTKAQYPCNSCP